MISKENTITRFVKSIGRQGLRVGLLLILALIVGCSAQLPSWEGKILTVDGPVDANLLGKTLSHEHALVDFVGAAETGYHRWDREEVVSVVLPRLEAIRKLGYQALFECTPAYIGRDPLLLQMLSKASGLKFITNTGYYGARENKYIPEWALSATADELAEKWIGEFENGIEDTGVRPGFIKIGVDRGDRLTDFHETLARAACRTHLKTGLTIACHTGPSKSIFQIAEILEEEGVSGEAFIWVHATRDEPRNLVKAAELGLWVSLDNLRDNANLLRGNVERLVALKEAGKLDSVLVSQDAGWYRPGEEGGGAFAPYTFVELNLVPALKKAGFTEEDIRTLLVNNPARAYAARVRSAR